MVERNGVEYIKLGSLPTQRAVSMRRSPEGFAQGASNMPQPTYSLHNRRVICRVVLAGSYLLVAAMSFLLLLSLSLHNSQALSSLVVCGAGFLYLGITHAFGRLHHDHTAAYLLVAFYALIAAGIVWTWGIDDPIALLIFALVIVLAGMLLTAGGALSAALVSSAAIRGSAMPPPITWLVTLSQPP